MLGLASSEGLGPNALRDVFTCKYSAYLFRAGQYVTWRKVNRCQSIEVRESSTSMFQQNNGSPGPEPSLKEPNFVNHVLASVECAVLVPVFSSHYEKGHCGRP